MFLPGAMTGLILAGVDPVDAVLVQAAVMYVVLASVVTTTTVVALGVRRRLFTRDHRLVRITRLEAGRSRCNSLARPRAQAAVAARKRPVSGRRWACARGSPCCGGP